MRKPFSVSILSSDNKVYEGTAVSLTVPGAEGSLGIWADHMPYLAMLKPGKILLQKTEDQAPMVIDLGTTGIVETLHNKVTVLLNS